MAPLLAGHVLLLGLLLLWHSQRRHHLFHKRAAHAADMIAEVVVLHPGFVVRLLEQLVVLLCVRCFGDDKAAFPGRIRLLAVHGAEHAGAGAEDEDVVFAAE